jgi:hypothetical protein
MTIFSEQFNKIHCSFLQVRQHLKSNYKTFLLALLGSAFLFHGTVYARSSGGGKSSAGTDYRSAKSGQYVKKTCAQRNKSTTVRERRSKK